MNASKRYFVEALIKEAGTYGTVNDDVLVEAQLASHRVPPTLVSKPDKLYEWALAKAKARLHNTEIRDAIREVYETVELDVLQQARLHAKHIRGEFKKEVIDKNGVKHLLKIPPNYEALRDLMKLTFPQPAVRVDKRVLVGHAKVGGPPAIGARSIAEEVEEIVERDN